MFKYQMKGTCATQVEIDIVDGVITHCRFTKGCTGNANGLSRLVVGLNAEDVARKLMGTPCKGTASCPDQLARAILAFEK